MNQKSEYSRLNRPLKPGEVLVYSEENYEGKEWLIAEEKSSLDLHFQVASLRVGPQTGVTIFADFPFQGVSQDLSADLNTFKGSKLKDQAPKSLKIWSLAGKPFTGYWAIEAAEGKYLSVQSGTGRLTISPSVGERELFRITDAGEAELGRTPVTISLRGLTFPKPAAPLDSLTIADLEAVIQVGEPEKGFRRFSLLAKNKEWVVYHPDEDHFSTSAEANDRTIFCQAVKIAEDETQVGELLQGEAALFENPCYWGKAWIFYTDYANFDRFVDLNDQVSSIQLGPYTGITIYRGAQFTADQTDTGKQDVTFNIPALEKEMDNQISSMSIWRVVTAGELGVTFTCCLSQDFRPSKAPGGKLEEYSAYRTTVSLPMTMESIEIWTTDEADILVDEKPYHVDEDHPATPPSNLLQRYVITTDAVASREGEAPRASLTAPGLKIRTNTMQPEERILIYPDQHVHERLAGLKDTDLYDAGFTDKDGVEHKVFKERSSHKKDAVANAQGMIARTMSTVVYTKGKAGMDQGVSPDGLQGKAWALDFLNYRVTADSLYVRQGAGIEFKPIGALYRDQIVEVLETNPEGDWIHILRPSDGLTGWSSSRFLDKIAEINTQQKGEKYRITAEVGVHLREGPGKAFRSLGYLLGDDVVSAIAVNENGTWRKIVRSDGLVGWAYARYMKLVETRPQLVQRRLAAAEPVEEVLDQPGFTPEVKFHEISPEEVNAMLASAESPETALAQGFFGSLVRGIKKAVSVVITPFKKGLALIINLAGKFVTWVLDTAQKVVAFVEGIIEKIGAIIEEIVKWLRFLFEFGDILDTRDYLRNSIRSSLKLLSHTLRYEVKDTVRKFIRQNKGKLIGYIDEAIRAMGGTVDQGKSGLTMPGWISDLLDSVDWILSKILNLGSDLLEFGDDNIGSGALEDYWTNALAKVIGAGVALPEGVFNAVASLAKNPGKPLLAIAALLNGFRSMLVGLIDATEDLVMGLFDLGSELILAIKKLINARIRIPFISDIFDWIGIDLPLNFSLLDAFSLILAIPVTIISKAVIGKAPFRGVPELAQSVNTNGFDITIGVANVFNGIISAVLDGFKSLGKWGSVLEIISFLCVLLCWVMYWFPDSSDDIWSGEGLIIGLFLYDIFILVFDVLSFAADIKDGVALKRFKRGPKTATLASALGGVHMLMLFKNNDDLGERILDGLTATPEVLSFLSQDPTRVGRVVLCTSDVASGGIAMGLSLKAG